jgi:predicted nucleic acid-binding Zn ribbon protein
MKRIYEFVCENGHRMEKLTGYETAQVPCEDCGGVALKTISAPAIKLEGWSGSFPGAANKFDRIHREKLAAEQKANS